MIAFDLQCTNGHEFEGWFEDSKAYEEQDKTGLVSCPFCNSTSVTRKLSTFSIKKSLSPKALQDKEKKEVEDISNRVIDYVKNNFEDVGSDFTKEALKMHYGVNEPRNIRGFSTKEEEKTLKKEGIQFFKLPIPVPSDTDS